MGTVRGSGTNGYVQRNHAFVRKGKDDIKFKTEEDIKRMEAAANREPNQGILDHERKRKLEVKCMELEEVLQDQGYKDTDIEEKVSAYRMMLLSKEVSKKAFTEVDEFGRPILKDTHQIAEAQKEKNSKLKDAFGISDFFVEGSSFDPNRKALEEAAREINKQKFALVPFEDEKEVKEKKKKKRKASSSDSDSSDSEEEKKKKKKKRKKEKKKEKKEKSKKRSTRSPSPLQNQSRERREYDRHEDIEIKIEPPSSRRDAPPRNDLRQSRRGDWEETRIKREDESSERHGRHQSPARRQSPQQVRQPIMRDRRQEPSPDE